MAISSSFGQTINTQYTASQSIMIRYGCLVHTTSSNEQNQSEKVTICISHLLAPTQSYKSTLTRHISRRISYQCISLPLHRSNQFRCWIWTIPKHANIISTTCIPSTYISIWAIPIIITIFSFSTSNILTAETKACNGVETETGRIDNAWFDTFFAFGGSTGNSVAGAVFTIAGITDVAAGAAVESIFHEGFACGADWRKSGGNGGGSEGCVCLGFCQ